MAGLMRMLLGMILSAFAARIVDGLMNPKKKGAIPPNDKGTAIPTLDLKPCPVCGVYTAQPSLHCVK